MTIDKIFCRIRLNFPVTDFYPLSIAAGMEPFLNIMGYGFYFIRPSPFCGYELCRFSGLTRFKFRFATCLLNTEKSFTSYPVTRLFDFGKLFEQLKPLLPRLQDGKIGNNSPLIFFSAQMITSGLVNAKKLKKVIIRSF